MLRDHPAEGNADKRCLAGADLLEQGCRLIHAIAHVAWPCGVGRGAVPCRVHRDDRVPTRQHGWQAAPETAVEADRMEKDDSRPAA